MGDYCLLPAVLLLLLVTAKIGFAGDAGNEPNLLRLGSGNVLAGKQKSSAERCQECHGEDGISVDARIPNHAGQYAAYLSKQLRDFQSGARVHEVMTVMAADLDAADNADIAAYFASQKPMQGRSVPDNPLAKKLFNFGDQERNLPACVSCHGESGKGRIADSVVYPLIGGQRQTYLRGQLFNWKFGERNNSPEAVMSKVAKLLSDEEINALAEYISGQ
jgi:cytochrome c553